MLREELEEGQAMVVWRGVGTRHRYDARVDKIARKYVTIEMLRGKDWTEKIEFDIETQKARGSDTNYPTIFRTPEQQALMDRQEAADTGLKELGLLFRSARSLSLNEMEAVITLIGRMRSDQEVPGA